MSSDYSSDLDLEGWGEIATHIGTSIDTARRWAKKGMPVTRLTHTRGVAACRATITAWLESREVGWE